MCLSNFVNKAFQRIFYMRQESIMSIHTPHITYFHPFHSLPPQRGQGIGQIFSSMYNSIIPLVKSALGIGSKVVKSKVGQKAVKSIKKRAMDAGINVVNDALKGENVIQSTKKQLKRAGEEVIGDMIKPNTPIKVSRLRKKVKRRKIQSGKGTDIFML